jgi:CRP/FNR family cyclic AMP-dependent transcriptional regulator
MHTLDEIVADSPIFEGLAQDQLELIAGCARNVGFEQGERLFREGEPADTFFLVRKGRVSLSTRVPARGAMAIETLDPGEIVGWSWLFPPYVWHFDARAVDDVRAVAFDGACLRGKCDADHDLGYELMGRFAAVMIDRLQHTRLRLLDIYGDGSSS